MKATLQNYRQAPRKVRLVANLIKGKPVMRAELELKHLAKRASLPIEKLLSSAIANAVVAGFDKENLIVLNVRVDKGVVLKRHMPRAFGRAAEIRKHSSHVILTLAEKTKTSRKSKVESVKAKPEKSKKADTKTEPKAKKITKVKKAKTLEPKA